MQVENIFDIGFRILDYEVIFISLPAVVYFDHSKGMAVTTKALAWKYFVESCEPSGVNYDMPDGSCCGHG